MEKIQMANGMEFQVSSVTSTTIAGVSYLYIRLMDTTVSDAAISFGDPDAAGRISYNDDIYEGYKLAALLMEGTVIRVNMVR